MPTARKGMKRRRVEKARLVRPSKIPAHRDAYRQPSGGAMPSKSLVERARKAWGIEAYFTGKLVPIMPKAGGSIVHAKLDAHHTLCTISTDEWVQGGVTVDEHVNCLWCLTRVKGR